MMLVLQGDFVDFANRAVGFDLPDFGTCLADVRWWNTDCVARVREF